jgi:hypothetical protein
MIHSSRIQQTGNPIFDTDHVISHESRDHEAKPRRVLEILQTAAEPRFVIQVCATSQLYVLQT